MSNELAELVRKIEDNRKRRELFQTGGAAILGLGLLTLVAFTLPGLAPKPAPVAEAPQIPAVNPYGSTALTAKAAIVYDLTTGKILYQKNAHAQLPLASLTKLLTIYAGANALGEGSTVTITNESLLPEGDSGFVAGQTFAFAEIAKAALVASSNDAAEAIAETAQARRSVSADTLMASAASAAGLSETYAVNGTGLDVNEQISGGYGSAEDIAMLAGALFKKVESIVRATTKPSVTVQSLSGQTYTFKNTNPTVESIPGLMLSKTGYTDLAGGNLAVIFDASINHPIAVVVLGSTVDGRFTDVQALIRATLTSFVSLPTP